MSTSTPFWCDEWPRPPKRFPKSPPLGRLRSPMPTRDALAYSAACALRTASTIRIRLSVLKRRYAGFGDAFLTGSHVKNNRPSVGSRTPFTRRPSHGVPNALDRRHRIVGNALGFPEGPRAEVISGSANSIDFALGACPLSGTPTSCWSTEHALTPMVTVKIAVERAPALCHSRALRTEPPMIFPKTSLQRVAIVPSGHGPASRPRQG